MRNTNDKDHTHMCANLKRKNPHEPKMTCYKAI